MKTGFEFDASDAALQACNMKPYDLIDEIDHPVGPSSLIKPGSKADLVLNI